MSGLRGRAADFVLGIRLVLGDRDAPWGRLALMAVGIALGTAVLLAGVTLPNAVSTLHERLSNRQMPALAEQAPGAVSMRGEAVSESFYEASFTGVQLQQLRPDAPVPPGVERIPAPGELVVSPALRQVLDSPEGASLRERMPGHVIGLIGPEGLGGERELFYYAGAEHISPGGTAKAVTDHFGEQPGWDGMAQSVWMMMSLGICVLLLPVVVFVLSTARLAEVARQRRLAALRLIGAGKRQIRRIAAGENLVGAVMGVLFGWTIYLLGRDLLVRYTTIDGTYFPADLWPVWWSALLVTLGVPVVTVGIVVLSLRSTVMDPLGVVRGRPSKRRRVWWRLIPPVVGVAGIVVSGVLSSTSVESVYDTALLGCSMALSLLTVPLLLPWLVEITGGRATGGPVAWQLALRRLQVNGGAAARSVSTVAVVVTGVVALQTMLAPGVSGLSTYDGDRRDLSISGQLRDSEPPGMTAAIDEITALPGVESARGDQSFTLRGDSPAFVNVVDCARIERLSRVQDCRDGDVFVAETQRGPAPTPGTTWEVGDSGGAPQATWTVGPVRELPDGADRELTSGWRLLATPAAVAGVPPGSRSVTIEAAVAADAPPQVIEQVRTISAAWFDESTVYHTHGSVSGAETAENLFRYATLLGGLLTVLLVGSSLLVSAIEQIQDGARPMAVLGAVGAPRSTLMWSAFLQNVVPLALAIGLAVPSGLALGWITSAVLTDTGLAIDLPGMGLVIGVAVVLVLVVTALTASTISRVLRPEELRTG